MPALSDQNPDASAPVSAVATIAAYGYVPPDPDLNERTRYAHAAMATSDAVGLPRTAIDVPAPEEIVPIVTDSDIVAARRRGRAIALRAGLSSPDAMLVATAISELARNIILYAKSGEIVLRPLQHEERPGVLVIARDEGPGIADAEHAAGGPSVVHSTIGIGLRGLKRLMDEFAIDSKTGCGTTVIVTKWRS